MHSYNKRVLVLQHAEPEHLGHIAEALTQEGVGYTYLRSDLGQPIPKTLDGYQGLIVMGGPQSVYEEDRFPFLRAEKSLAHHAILMNRPVLGVCLGSQILAEVLGSRVYPGSAFELGWKKVRLSSEAAYDPLLNHLQGEITPLHWHGDVYDLPEGAKPIGSSEIASVQGFSWEERAYGFLFHLEMTPAQLAAMVEAFPDDVARGSTTPAAIMAEAAEGFAALIEPGLEVFRRWAKLL